MLHQPVGFQGSLWLYHLRHNCAQESKREAERNARRALSSLYRRALSSTEGLSLLQKGFLFYRRALSSTEGLSLL
jgi:hypothetical protein